MALYDAGLLKEAQDTMDPIVQQGIQKRRTAAAAGGNQSVYETD